MKFFGKVFVLTFLVSFITIFTNASADAAGQKSLTIPLNNAELINLPEDFTNVSISDKKVLRVIKHNSRKVSLVGKRSGSARVSLSKAGRTIWRADVNVGADIPAIKHAVNQFFPDENIEVKQMNKRLVLSGVVTDAEIAHRVVQIAEGFAEKNTRDSGVINMMQVKTSQQVMLRVQVSEVQRGALDNLGFSGSNTFTKSRNISQVLDSLAHSGVAKILAEPNLIALSGQSAEFLSGGEFPVPTSNGKGEVSVEYKPYGVSLKFTPLVLSKNRIHLTVEPEVSELSDDGAVRTGGVSVPAVSSRRVKTAVELAPGESFMIAGLISANSILGKSSELVIAVTPYLVNPVAAGDIRLPTDHSYSSKILDSSFMEGIGARKNGKSSLEGSHGYMVE